jgi:O-antigen ligase
LPILAFVAVAAASDLLSPYGPPPLEFATLWRSVLGFFLVAQGLRLFADPQRASLRLVYFACAGLAFASLVGIAQYRSGIDVIHLLHLREQPAWVEAPGVPGRFGAMGFFTSRLTFGHDATVLVSLLGGALAAGAVPRGRIWIVAGAGLLALDAIALTFDRGAYLGLCAAAVAIAVFASRRARRTVAVVLALALLIAVVHPGVRGRFATAFSRRTNSDRVFLWTRAGEIIHDHPLLGVGFANYPRICDRYYDRVDPNFPMRTWAHNLELSTLAEMGPLGLAALFWLLIAAGLALVRRARAGVPLLALGGLAAAAALFAIAQAHDVVYDTKVMFPLWFCLGLALSPAFERPG